MFNLIRRISGSVIPRQDRPWREDATSNAPTVGRKRRMSSFDTDAEVQAFSKKPNRGIAEDQGESDSGKREGSPAQAKDTEEVKEVTKGVNEVELDDVGGSKTEDSIGETLAAANTPPLAHVREESKPAENVEVVLDEINASTTSTLSPEAGSHTADADADADAVKKPSGPSPADIPIPPSPSAAIAPLSDQDAPSINATKTAEPALPVETLINGLDMENVEPVQEVMNTSEVKPSS